MKRVYVLFVSMLLLFLAAACKDTKPEPQPEPPTPPVIEHYFDFEIHEVTKTEVCFSVTPALEEMTYLVMIIDKPYFDDFESESDYVADDLAWLASVAEQEGLSLEQLLSDRFLKQGTLTRERSADLLPDVEYYLYAYGLTPEGLPTTDLEKIAFKTRAIERVEVDFEVEVCDIDFTSARVKVTPDPLTTIYFINVMSEEDLSYWGGDEEAYAEHLMSLVSYYLGRGATLDQIFANFGSSGVDEWLAEDLSPATKYYAYAIGVDEEFFANTAPEVVEFETLSAQQSDMTFECNFEEIFYDHAEGTLTPSNSEEGYLCSIQLAESLDWYPDNKAYMEALVTDFDYWYGGVEKALKYGPADLSLLATLEPETDYVVVCFGWDGAPTTDLSTFPFTTPKALGEADLLTFEFEVKNLTHNSATVTIIPSNGCHYFAIEREWDYFQEMSQQLGGDDAAAAYFVEEEIFYGAELFGGDRAAYLLDMGASQGRYEQILQNLKPATEYVMVAMAVDVETGEIASPKGHLSELFTTEEKVLSDATVEITWGNYYDGTILSEIRPDLYLNCKGYAVMPYTVTVNATAVQWYTQFYPYNMLDWGEITDDDIYDWLITWGYDWDPESVMVNHTEGIAVLSWDDTSTFLGVAEDVEGNFGKGFIKTVTPNRMAVGPVDEFLAHHVPKSLQTAAPLAVKRPLRHAAVKGSGVERRSVESRWMTKPVAESFAPSTTNGETGLKRMPQRHVVE